MHTPIKTWLGVMIIIIIALSAGMFIWYCQKNYVINYVNIKTPQINKKACTEEAKLCPDGTYVSRHLPDCEFAPCSENTDCAKEGESIGAVVPNAKLRKCCDGLNPIVPKDIVGTQGICKKIVTINYPAANAEISSPVTVSGQARGSWFFEGSFPVQVYNDNNKLLGTSTAKFVPKSESDTWMTEDFINFSGEIKFSQPTTDSGYILFKKDNPSGLPQNDEAYKLPVKFKSNISDWQTYRGEKYGFEFQYPGNFKIEDANKDPRLEGVAHLLLINKDYEYDGVPMATIEYYEDDGLYNPPSNVSVKDWVAKNIITNGAIYDWYKKGNDVSIDNLPTVHIVRTDGINSDTFYVIKNGRLFEISVDTNTDYHNGQYEALNINLNNPDLLQVKFLKSFKFTN